MTRVALVAASPISRAGIASLLSGNSGIEILGSFGDLVELSGLLEDLAPDAVLVEIDHSGADTPEVLTTLARAPAVVLLVSEWDSAAAVETLRAGARGVLPRDAGGQEIVAALHAAAAGLAVLSPDFLPQLAADSAEHAPAPGEEGHDTLTPRETQVLRMLAGGAANKTIAWQLGISEHTVKFHVASILTKLNAGSRTEAVSIGLRRGLVLL